MVEGGRGKVWWREGGKRCGGERKIDRVVERGREKMWWREGGREGEDVAEGRGEKI